MLLLLLPKQCFSTRVKRMCYEQGKIFAWSLSIRIPNNQQLFQKSNAQLVTDTDEIFAHIAHITLKGSAGSTLDYGCHFVHYYRFYCISVDLKR